MQRVAYLDGLRGLTALDVVITHFRGHFLPARVTFTGLLFSGRFK